MVFRMGSRAVFVCYGSIVQIHRERARISTNDGREVLSGANWNERAQDACWGLVW